MKLMYSVLIAVTVLIAVPYTLSADALEMKYVPFWWSIDPQTGEEVYTDYFKAASGVQQEHNAYLAATAIKQIPSTLNPSIMLEVERLDMVEVITWEMRNITVRESVNDHGPFANPDYNIRELVATSTWVPIEVPELPVIIEDVLEEVPEVVTEITEDVTPEVVTEITEDVTPVTPQREANGRADTHWDQEEQHLTGHSDMSPQELKDMKKKHEAWKAYDVLSSMYPSIYPAYVHHNHDVSEDIVEDVVVVVPLDDLDRDLIVVPLN